MRFTETMKSLARRWYIVLLGLALTAGMAYLVSDKVPTTFEATGSVILMPPSETVGIDGNPYLSLGGLNEAQEVLVRRSSALEVTEPILSGRPGSSYSVQSDRTASTPIIVVTAEARTAASAIETREVAMESVIGTLKVMQDEAHVKKELRVNAQNLVVDADALPKTKTKTQLLLLAVGGGAVGTLILAGAVDGWLIERRIRKSSTRLSSAVTLSEPAEGPIAAPPGRRAANPAPSQSEGNSAQDSIRETPVDVELSSSNSFVSTPTDIRVTNR